MERLPYLLMAAVWWLLGAFVVRWPQTLSGYNTMPPARREAVDIRGAGRFLARLCRLSALLTLAGLPLAGTAAGRWLLVLPVGLLLAGAVAARRYDMCAAARRVRRGKERFLPLLLEGDESERMIRRYLDRAELYVCRRRGRTIVVCAVTDEGGGRFGVKNLAVAAPFRRQGYGRRMLACVAWRYRRRGAWLTLGTGETPSTLAFYRACGFRAYGRRERFFTDNYDRPIVEEGVELRDMILLRKRLRPRNGAAEPW